MIVSGKKRWELFWEERKETGSQDDSCFQELSLDVILKFLKPVDNILSVGCGDGYGLDKYCKFANVVGMDYSSKAIKIASELHKNLIDTGKMELVVCDLLNVQQSFVGRFDTVVSERCLCNLKSKKDQIKALEIIGNYLKPDGIAIVCEPSKQGYILVNKMRKIFGLSPLKKHLYNLRLDEAIFFSIESMKVQEHYTFGVYTLISRIFYPLLIYPKDPRIGSKENKIATSLCKQMITEPGYNIPSQHVLYILRRG